MSSEKKNTGSKVIVIVAVLAGLLFVIVFVIGILAAIAIPSFVQYQNQAKGAMVTMTLLQIDQAIQTYHLEKCEFPPPLAPSSLLPVGGESVEGNLEAAGWNEIGMMVPNNSYFRYRTEQAGNVVRVIADADMSEGGPVHTVEVTLIREGEPCELTSTPAVTTHEFE